MAHLNMAILEELSVLFKLDATDLAEIIGASSVFSNIFGIDPKTVGEIIIAYATKEVNLNNPPQDDTLRLCLSDPALHDLLNILADRIENPHPMWKPGAEAHQNNIQINFHDFIVVLIVECALRINKSTVY